MNVGRTLIGAVLGAAVAIGIYLAVRVGLELQATWFPVVTGLLVGLGVRQVCSSGGLPVSYARGALAGLIAAGAIFGSEFAAQQVMVAKLADVEKPQPRLAANADDDADDEEVEAGDSDVDPITLPRDAASEALRGSAANQSKAQPMNKGDFWPFLFIGVGVFLAYEFARGSAPKAAATTEEPLSDPPAEEPVADDHPGDHHDENATP